MVEGLEDAVLRAVRSIGTGDGEVVITIQGGDVHFLGRTLDEGQTWHSPYIEFHQGFACKIRNGLLRRAR